MPRKPAGSEEKHCRILGTQRSGRGEKASRYPHLAKRIPCLPTPTPPTSPDPLTPLEAPALAYLARLMSTTQPHRAPLRTTFQTPVTSDEQFGPAIKEQLPLLHGREGFTLPSCNLAAGQRISQAKRPGLKHCRPSTEKGGHTHRRGSRRPEKHPSFRADIHSGRNCLCGRT